MPHLVVGYRFQAGFFQLRAGMSPLITIVDGGVGVVPLPRFDSGIAFL